MYSVNATELKNRLGPVLARAALEPVAVMRHGRVVAVLTPPRTGTGKPARKAAPTTLHREEEDRLVRLCASGDLRPSRWMRAGDRRMLAGVATMLASQPEFDRLRLLSLAERLHPGMSTPEEFARWLESAPVKAARLLPMVRKEMSRVAG
jgi:antitoxin (DNA-binding transcriptional repressor) of toxin-antitoxin stability system